QALGSHGRAWKVTRFGGARGPWAALGPGRRPVDADGLHPASLALPWITSRGAALEHAHVAERKVVAHRVLGRQAGEGAGNLDRCPPSHGAPRRQPEVSPELVGVAVDRHEQPARRHELAPEAEVDAVLGPDQPAK